MKMKYLKLALKEETNKINLQMSAKLKECKIQEKQTPSQNKTKFPFKRIYASLAIACFVAIFCCLPIMLNQQSQSSPQTSSKLTSYIIKINPAFCITTNESDEVVNICALNDDADSVLSSEAFDSVIGSTFSDCVSLLINNVDSSVFENYNGRKISLYAINDDKTITDEKLNQFGNLIKENLDRRGFGNIEFDKYDMSVDFFRKEMGIPGEFEKLDDMQKAIENHPRFYDITRFSQKK